jgi:hypothetical protein
LYVTFIFGLTSTCNMHENGIKAPWLLVVRLSKLRLRLSSTLVDFNLYEPAARFVRIAEPLTALTYVS